MREKILGTILYAFFWIYSKTWRYRLVFENESDKERFFKDFNTVGKHTDNFIYAFFHQDEIALTPYFARKKIVAMVSQSKDGSIMARALECFGYFTVRGSSHRRAVAAFIECLKRVKEGYKTTFAVDGPRGPIYEVKNGIIKLSEKSQKEIVPCRVYAHNKYIFEKSWQKMILPMPFSRIDLRIGPIGFYQKEKLQEHLLSKVVTS